MGDLTGARVSTDYPRPSSAPVGLRLPSAHIEDPSLMKRPEAPATDPSGRRFAHDSEASEGKSRIGGFSLSQSPKSSIPAI